MPSIDDFTRCEKILMDSLLKTTLHSIENKLDLTSVAIPRELEVVNFPFNLLRLRCYNWKAAKVQKIYFIRMSVKMPRMEYFGMAIYPEASYDTSIFYFDLSHSRKKAIAYINFIPMLNSESYYRKYIAQLESIHDRYHHIPPRQTPGWMSAYVTPSTVYAMPEITFLDDLKKCGLEYLSQYLEVLAGAQAIDNAEYARQILEGRNKYISHMIANDLTKKMLGKLIGKKKAARIFNEVLT